MEKVLRLSRLLTGVGASMPDMIRITLLIQPQLMLLTIPMSLLLSVLLTYGRMNADSELVVLRAAGMPFRGIALPVFVMGVFSFLLSLFMSSYASPFAERQLRESLADIIARRAPLAIEAGVFNTGFRDLIILVKEKPAADSLEGIFIYDNRSKQEPKVLTAKHGKISGGAGGRLSLTLSDGYVHIGRGEGSTEIFFERYNLALDLTLGGPSRKNSELTPRELLAKISGASGRERVPLFLEFNRRLSLPFICLLLMFLGPPISLVAGKSGRLGGLTIGLAVFALFYVMLIYGENLARAGKVPHYLGSWMPVIVLGASSFWAFRKAAAR
jgi:lipopolysaccharide export system permease protein